jgi:hypothetical protein
MSSQWPVSLRPFVLAAATAAVFTVPAEAGSPRWATLTGWDAAAVERAREGAARRLQDPECQKVFSDFTDAEGRTIQQNLEAWAMSPSDYLKMIPFVDGSRERLCRQSKIALVAQVNVRRVVVCPSFADFQLRQPLIAESMLIHEILHTLGLGENPPTSIEITQRVESRCH